MKSGLFIHQLVEDPSSDDSSFGRLKNGKIECSEEGHQLKTYFNNRKIIEELGKEYQMFWHHDILWAARRLSGSNPLDDHSFMITNVPPIDYHRKMSRDERVNYAYSLRALRDIRRDRPDMPLIAYTGAPKEIREACLELGAFVLHRERFGLKIETEELKRMILGTASADSAW